MLDKQFGKVNVKNYGLIPFTYYCKTHRVTYDTPDEILMSYNALRYLSGAIKALCQYYNKAKVVRIGDIEILEDRKDPKVVKINKITMQL